MSHNRIVSNGLAGHQTNVYLVDDDEVLHHLDGVRVLDLHAEVGERNRVTLEVRAVGAETDAQLENLVAEVLPPERGREVVRRLVGAVGLRIAEDE